MLLHYILFYYSIFFIIEYYEIYALSTKIRKKEFKMMIKNQNEVFLKRNYSRSFSHSIQGRVIGVTIGCLIGMTPIPLAGLFRSDS